METKDYEIINRLDDFIDLAARSHVVSTTHFFNPHEQSLALDKLKKARGIKYKVIGGYDISERNIIVIYPDDNFLKLDEYLGLVQVDFSKYDTKYLNHRMILGSVLALGIKRNGVGDIILDKDKAYIIATKQMAKYICDHLVKVANATVSTTYLDSTHHANLAIKKPSSITGTIASLRLDCVLALALRISRTKISDEIKNKLVYVNWQLATKATLQIAEGDVITIRQKGRVVLKSIGNASKKNRIWVEVEVFR